MARKRKPGSESAGYHFDGTVSNPNPSTPTKAPPPSEAAKGPAGDYAGAEKDFENAVAALPPEARAVTEAASGITTSAGAAAAAAAAKQAARERQQQLVTRYVTKAYSQKLQHKGVPSVEISARVEQAKQTLAKERARILDHPAVEAANAAGKVVSPKGLHKLEQRTHEYNAIKGPHGLERSKLFGIRPRSFAGLTPAQALHLQKTTGTPQGTVGRTMARIKEEKPAPGLDLGDLLKPAGAVAKYLTEKPLVEEYHPTEAERSERPKEKKKAPVSPLQQGLNALEGPHGLEWTPEHGWAPRSFAHLTQAQMNHLAKIQGTPQGTVGKQMATIRERHHEEGEPTNLDALLTAANLAPGVGIAPDLAKLTFSGAKVLPEILSKEAVSKAATRGAETLAKVRSAPVTVAAKTREIPGFLREAPALAKGAAKEAPQAAKVAAKAAPKAAARSAARGTQHAYEAGSGLAALATADRAGVHLPGGKQARALVEGQEEAFAEDPGKVLAATANLLPGLLVSAAQGPVAVGQSGGRAALNATGLSDYSSAEVAAPIAGFAEGQKDFAQHIYEAYLTGDKEKIKQATLREGLLPEVMLGPLIGKLGKAVHEPLLRKAREVVANRRAPATDSEGDVLLHEHGGPVRKGSQRRPAEGDTPTVLRQSEKNQHRREEAFHAATLNDQTHIEIARRRADVDKHARKAAGSRRPVREGLGKKGKDTLHDRPTDYIGFLARAGIDLRNPDSALREIKHYEKAFGGLDHPREYGVNPEALTARDAVRHFVEHPEELRDKHLAAAVEAFRAQQNGETGYRPLGFSLRNQYLGPAVMHGVLLPEERAPIAARAHTSIEEATAALREQAKKLRDRTGSAKTPAEMRARADKVHERIGKVMAKASSTGFKGEKGTFYEKAGILWDEEKRLRKEADDLEAQSGKAGSAARQAEQLEQAAKRSEERGVLTREAAWAEHQRRRAASAALRRTAREKAIEARGAAGEKAARLKAESRSLYAEAKDLARGAKELRKALDPYTRPGAKLDPSAKRMHYDEELAREFADETRALLEERGLHAEPAYVPDQAAVSRASGDESTTGGQKPLPGGPRMNAGYVWQHGLSRQGYEHLMNEGIARQVVRNHQFADFRRFRQDRGIEFEGRYQHNGKGWGRAFDQGIINRKDVVLVPTQVLNRLERATQGGDPTDYELALAEIQAARKLSPDDAQGGTIYEAFPKVAYEEKVAQVSRSNVPELVRRTNALASRAMLSTPSFVGMQVIAEGMQSLAEVNPLRQAQGLRAFGKLNPEQQMKLSGAAGETAKAIFSPDDLQTALGSYETKPFKDALGFFRRNVFGRSARSFVTMEAAKEINRLTGSATRRGVMTGMVMRDVDGLWAKGRRLLKVQTSMQKRLEGKSPEEALAYIAEHPKLLDHYQRRLHDAMGGWSNLTRTGRLPESARAAGLVFYPFLRMSVQWPIKYAMNHPLRAMALSYVAAENNWAIRQAQEGEPSFLNYAQIPTFEAGPHGKPVPGNPIDLSRAAPVGGAWVQAIQGSGSLLGAVQPVPTAIFQGLTGQGPLGPVDGGVPAHVAAAGASLLELSPYVRAIDQARGQKRSGQSDLGVLADRANLALDPLAALSAKLKGSPGSQITRSLLLPVLPKDLEKVRDTAKLGRILGRMGDNGSDAQSKVLSSGSTRSSKQARAKVVQMQKRYDKASGELQAMYKKYGLGKVAKREEEIYEYTHPFPGSTEESGGIYGSKGSEGSSSIYDSAGSSGTSIYGGSSEEAPPPPVPFKGNGVGLPGFNPLAAIGGTIGSLVGGDPAQAAEIASSSASRFGKPTKASRHSLDFLGKKTAGNPTQQELLAAGRAGKLTVNKKGKILTPAVRKAAKELRRAYSSAVPTIEGFDNPDQQEFAQWFSHFSKLPPKLAGEWTKQEGGGWGSKGVSGGEAGEQNWLGVGYPGQKTPMSESHYFNGVSPKQAAKNTALWMEGKIGHEFGYRAAASIQRISQMAKEGASESQIRAYIEGPSEWGTGAISQSGIVVRPPKDGASKALRIAKRNAKRVGLNPTPFNGDIERGAGRTVTVRADARGMVNWARSALGTQEGTGKQHRWADMMSLGYSEPWCADFVAVGLQRRGVPLPSNPNGSGSYEDPNWTGGSQIGTDIKKAKPGDLVVYGGGAHIAVYVGNGQVIAGNWSDEVAEYGADEDSRGISAIVRPHYHGGKIQVHESTVLPGSTSETTFTSGGEGSPAVPGWEGSSTAETASTAAERKEKVHGLTAMQRLHQVNDLLSGDLTRYGVPAEEASSAESAGPSYEQLASLGKDLSARRQKLRGLALS